MGVYQAYDVSGIPFLSSTTTYHLDFPFMSNSNLPSRPAQPSNEEYEGRFHVVNVLRIPANTTLRHLRKVIGRNLYHIQRDPPIRFSVSLSRTTSMNTGKITFVDAAMAKIWFHKHGSRHSLYPIEINGSRLSFSKSFETVPVFKLLSMGDVDDEEVDSDYDEGGDEDDHDDQLKLARIDCGGFDDEGRFCVGWTKQAETRGSFVSFDVDEARLRIRCENLVVQALTYDIKYIYAGEKYKKIYFEFKHPPMLLKDDAGEHSKDSLAWLETAPINYHRSQELFKRVAYFDEEHSRCVQYGTVYRIHLCQGDDPLAFFKSTKHRLRIRAKVKELEDNTKDIFDNFGVDKMLEKLDFVVAFQAQALLGPEKLLPGDLLNLRGELLALQRKIGAKEAANVLNQLKSELCPRGPYPRHEKWRSFTMKQVRDRLAKASTGSAVKVLANSYTKEKMMMIHSVFVTPSRGIRLEGPHPDEGNRILRLYPDQDENFLRVHLIEEDGSAFRVVYDYGSIDAEEMMHESFGRALRLGVMVGGRRFQYLAFSGSSLREHSCWFVRNFKMDGKKVKASTIRENIGDLDHIRSPARYAARMGQAFTATSVSIMIDASNVEVVEDVKTKDGRYEFSDGVGTMSQEVCDCINREIHHEAFQMPEILPSTFQIRMGGAKGMLSLDVRDKGIKVRLRKSMVKFESKPVNGMIALEVAHYYTKPLAMYLNRQMIALLESLGVAPEVFIALQDDAIHALQDSTITPEAAVKLLHRSGVGRGCNMEGIIRTLQSNGINAITQIPFLHDANMSLVNFALRNIKYRARIKVPRCYTLVGVMDETNTLAENQIVACINKPNEPVKYMTGRVLLGRSPMLAPGDVQYAQAVEPREGHALRAITNAVVFSQKGKRPLASMLSGGDLDGDLFNLIQHEGLMCYHTCEAADYGKTKLLELNRPCTVDDVVDFFLDYIKLDKLGLIAIRHLEVSDRSKEGVLDPDCLKLAAMHSIAVDFPKSGLLPEIREMPRAPREKPDYRKSEYRNEDCSEDLVKRHPRSKETYYPSQKALGKMFRSINIHKQMKEWADSSSSCQKIQEGWKDQVWDLLLQKNRGDGKWRQMVTGQQRLVEEYYARLGVIAQEHCPDEKGTRLQEEEVFMGHVICRGPNGSRMSRFDLTNRLQDDFLLICQDIRKRALFESSALMDLNYSLQKRNIWQWVMTPLGQKLTSHDLIKVQVDGVENLNDIKKELQNVIERGLAFTKAAMEIEEEKGRSAPWIIIPALLTAHSCLDVVESFLQRQEGSSSPDGSSSNVDEEDRDNKTPSSTNASSLILLDGEEKDAE